MNNKTNKEYGSMGSTNQMNNSMGAGNQSTTSSTMSETVNQTSVTNSTADAMNGTVIAGRQANMMNDTSSMQNQMSGSQQNQTQANTAGNQKNVGPAGSQTVVAVFSSIRSAENAVRQLRDQGFSQEEINIISKQNRGGDNYDNDDSVMDGTLTGGTLGGIGGLLLGAGALAIPGVGPIVAAGPIAAALGGAVAGGIAGGLIDWGIPAEDSRRYEQNIAQGDVLAIIRTTSQKTQQVVQTMQTTGASEVKTHWSSAK